MSVGVEVISRPLCKWNVYDIADFLYENGKNMNSDNWQRIADDMAMVAGDVRRLLDEALEEKESKKDREIEFLEDKVQELEDDLSEKNSKIETLRNEVSDLESRIDDLEDLVNGTE